MRHHSHHHHHHYGHHHGTPYRGPGAVFVQLIMLAIFGLFFGGMMLVVGLTSFTSCTLIPAIVILVGSILLLVFAAIQFSKARSQPQVQPGFYPPGQPGMYGQPYQPGYPPQQVPPYQQQYQQPYPPYQQTPPVQQPQYYQPPPPQAYQQQPPRTPY